MSKYILQKIANHLEFRFPIARFSKDLEYSKGAVSEFYNGKKDISENFIKKLEEKYNISVKDFIVNKNSSQNREQFLIDKIENETIEVLDLIDKEKILGYIYLNDKEFLDIPSFKSFIEKQKATERLRQLTKE